MFADSDILTTLQNAGPRTGANPIISGDIGDFYKVRWVVTTNARIQSSLGLSGADAYQTMILGKEYYALTELDAMQAKTLIVPVGEPSKTDPLAQYGTIGWKAAFVAARLNENFAVRIEHATSASNAA